MTQSTLLDLHLCRIDLEKERATVRVKSDVIANLQSVLVEAEGRLRRFEGENAPSLTSQAVSLLFEYESALRRAFVAEESSERQRTYADFAHGTTTITSSVARQFTDHCMEIFLGLLRTAFDELVSVRDAEVGVLLENVAEVARRKDAVSATLSRLLSSSHWQAAENSVRAFEAVADESLSHSQLALTRLANNDENEAVELRGRVSALEHRNMLHQQLEDFHKKRIEDLECIVSSRVQEGWNESVIVLAFDRVASLFHESLLSDYVQDLNAMKACESRERVSAEACEKSRALRSRDSPFVQREVAVAERKFEESAQRMFFWAVQHSADPRVNPSECFTGLLSRCWLMLKELAFVDLQNIAADKLLLLQFVSRKLLGMQEVVQRSREIIRKHEVPAMQLARKLHSACNATARELARLSTKTRDATRLIERHEVRVSSKANIATLRESPVALHQQKTAFDGVCNDLLVKCSVLVKRLAAAEASLSEADQKGSTEVAVPDSFQEVNRLRQSMELSAHAATMLADSVLLAFDYWADYWHNVYRCWCIEPLASAGPEKPMVVSREIQATETCDPLQDQFPSVLPRLQAHERKFIEKQTAMGEPMYISVLEARLELERNKTALAEAIMARDTALEQREQMHKAFRTHTADIEKLRADVAAKNKMIDALAAQLRGAGLTSTLLVEQAHQLRRQATDCMTAAARQD